MKHIESILSFVLSLVGVVFNSGRRRKPPCCPCPFVEDKPSCETPEKKERV